MNKLRTRPDLLVALFIALLALLLVGLLVANSAARLPYVVNY